MISNKCMYALKALLSLSRHDGQGPRTIAQIAEEQNIPSRFLEAILRQLKQHGFTDSIRGKEGGYKLAMPAEKITVADVVEVFESPVSPTGGDENSIFDPIWAEAEEALHSVYAAVSFRDLVGREDERNRQQSTFYSI